MSGCAIRRWGPGSGYTRPQNTEAVREAEQRLAAMKAERDRQDAVYSHQDVSIQPKSETKPNLKLEQTGQNGRM